MKNLYNLKIISLTPDEMIEKYKINFLIIQNKMRY